MDKLSTLKTFASFACSTSSFPACPRIELRFLRLFSGAVGHCCFNASKTVLCRAGSMESNKRGFSVGRSSPGAPKLVDRSQKGLSGGIPVYPTGVLIIVMVLARFG